MLQIKIKYLANGNIQEDEYYMNNGDSINQLLAVANLDHRQFEHPDDQTPIGNLILLRNNFLHPLAIVGGAYIVRNNTRLQNGDIIITPAAQAHTPTTIPGQTPNTTQHQTPAPQAPTTETTTTATPTPPQPTANEATITDGTKAVLMENAQATIDAFLTNIPHNILTANNANLRIVDTVPATPEPGITIVMLMGESGEPTYITNDNNVVVQAKTIVRNVNILQGNSDIVQKMIKTYINYLIDKAIRLYGEIPTVRNNFITYAQEHLTNNLHHWHSLQRPNPEQRLAQSSDDLIASIRSNTEEIFSAQMHVAEYNARIDVLENIHQKHDATKTMLDNIAEVDASVITIQEGAAFSPPVTKKISITTHPIICRYRGPNGNIEKNLGTFLIEYQPMDSNELPYKCIPLTPQGTLHPAYTDNGKINLNYYIIALLEAMHNNPVDGIQHIIRAIKRPGRLPLYDRLANAPDYVAPQPTPETTTTPSEPTPEVSLSNEPRTTPTTTTASNNTAA